MAANNSNSKTFLQMLTNIMRSDESEEEVETSIQVDLDQVRIHPSVSVDNLIKFLSQKINIPLEDFE